MLYCLTGVRVGGLNGLEEIKNVLCARCRPQSEETVIRVRERPTATNCYKAMV
jgi:hypothetical protein